MDIINQSVFDMLKASINVGSFINEEGDNSFIPNLKFTPEELAKKLDETIVKQNEAKLMLSSQILAHYKELKSKYKSGIDPINDDENIKRNIFLIGTTGVGKTLLVKTIAKILDVPFFKADATKFSKTGYVGGNVEDLVRGLIDKAGGDIKKAEHGIIMFDETDKIRASNHSSMDVSGVAIQQALLTVIEGTEIPVVDKHDPIAIMKKITESQMKKEMPKNEYINTKNILFIFCGAFPGIENVITQRVKEKNIGFGAQFSKKIEENDYVNHLKTEDLIKYGFEAEFIGRIPIRIFLDTLNKDDLYQIMKLKSSPIVKMIKGNLSGYGIDIKFNDNLFKHVSEIAIKEGTGARSLVTIFANLLKKYEQKLPEIKGLREVEITKEMVDGTIEPDEIIIEIKNIVELMNEDEARKPPQRYIDEINYKYNIIISFTEETISEIFRLSEIKQVNTYEVCMDIFNECEKGFEMMNQFCDDKNLKIDLKFLENPTRELTEMLRLKMKN